MVDMNVSLWPEIPINVVSPEVILKRQADLFNNASQRGMQCRVETKKITPQSENDNSQVAHDLIIYSQVLKYSHVLLNAVHDWQSPYPVSVFSEHFPATVDFSPEAFAGRVYIAETEEDFFSALKQILQSKSTLSVLNAISARINVQK